MEQTIEETQTLLQIRQLLANTHDHVITACLKEITHTLFDSDRSVLEFIAKNIQKDELHCIHEIIKNQNQIHQKNTLFNYFQVRKPEKECGNKNSSFAILPKELIHHICGYLNRNNVNALKSVCKRVGTICLNEMKRISVGIVNMPTICMKGNSNFHFLNIQNFVNKSRYPKQKQFHTLQEMWARNYGIPSNNQLLFHISNQNQMLVSDSRSRYLYYFDYTLVNPTQTKNESYLLLDTRSVVILHKDRTALLETNKNISELQNYRLLLLEYFDIKNQTFTVVNFILYRPTLLRNDLFRYIEHEFIAMNGINNVWYSELTNCLRQMNSDANHPKLCLYTHLNTSQGWAKNRTMVAMKNNHCIDIGKNILFTFQINSKHSWFMNTNTFDESEAFYTQKLQTFEVEAHMFAADSAILNLKIILKNSHILRECFEKYYNSKLSEEERNVFESEIDSVFNNVKNCIEIKLKVSQTIAVLKTKLSQMFGNVINPKYFEITQCGKRFEWHDRVSSFTVCRNSVCVINCDISLFNTQIYDNHISDRESKFYYVQILSPSQCPYPLYFINDKLLRIKVKYKRQFVFKEFLNYIFQKLSRSSDHILTSHFIDLVHIYYDDSHSSEMKEEHDCDMSDDTLTMSDKIKCVLQTTSWNRPKPMNIIEVEQTYKDNANNERMTYLNILMIRTKPYQKCRNFKLKIKFVMNSKSKKNQKSLKLNSNTNIKDIHNFTLIGFPLTIWIHKHDSIQNIFDRHLYKSKEFLGYCYRIKANDKVIVIPQNKWRDYEPYQFLWNAPNDFLMFKLNGKETNGAAIPIYSKELHHKY